MTTYSNLSKEQLIAEIKRLKKGKKFGLLWEDKPEDVAEFCKTKLPVLVDVEDKEIGDEASGPTNILIEGDNYHALSVLNYTHKGKIDVIYIDPPYNTGAKDWKYNNAYVDSTDTYRHSKWLSMMNKRLHLARNLLTENGIICVTIDDYEVARLTILMEEIFGETNHLGTVVIKNNPSGRSTEKGFSVAHEYALFYSRTSKASIGRLERNESQIARYGEKDKMGSFEWVNFRKHGATREESPAMFYPIYLTERSIRIPKIEWNKKKKEWLVLEKPNSSEVVSYPVDEKGYERRWKWSIERAQKEKDQMKVGMDRTGKLAVYIKSRLNEEGMLPLTWWDNKLYSATSYGTNLIKEMFSKLQVFSYPKSLWAVKDCLKVMSTKENAIILDFFAGSGTTGHAILELNKEDDGSRSFILCTNNENKIAEEVCYPRIKKVITGYKDSAGEKVKGLGGNLKYFCTDFVDADPTDKNKKKLTEMATEMLCLKEGTFEKITSKKVFKIYKNTNHYTGIIFDHMAIPDFKETITKLKGKFSVYVFSLGDDSFEDDFDDVKQRVKLSPIPEVILRVYRRIFK